MSLISYAQNLEDVLIARFFQGDAPQIYVDVGAAHPTYHSVTKHFSDEGWHGLNIEPRTHLWELLKAERPRDWNLQCGVADQAGELTFFEVVDPTFSGTDAGGLSTFDAGQAEGYRQQGLSVVEKKLLVHPLSRLLAVRNIREIGFLKVDVEGFEYRVIKSLNWDHWRPRLVITECTAPRTSLVCDENVCSFMAGQGYTAEFFDGLNRYFVRQEDASRADRLRVPANVTDGYMLADELNLRQQLHECHLQVKGLLADRSRVEAITEELRRTSERLQREIHCLLQEGLSSDKCSGSNSPVLSADSSAIRDLRKVA